jgi:hypothetical protein
MILRVSLAVLVHRYVQDPVQCVLDTPLRSYDLGEPRCRKRRAQQIIRRFRRCFVLDVAGAHYIPDRRQTRPGVQLLCPANIGVYRAGPGLDATMIGIDRRVRGLCRPSRVFQKHPDVVMQAAPIAFQGDHIVATLFNDLGADRALATHGIRRYDAAVQ